MLMTSSHPQGIQPFLYATLPGVRRQLTYLVLILLTTFSLIPNGATAQDQSINGVFIINRNASDDIGTAIDQTVARLSFVTRPTERAKLRKTNTSYSRITIATNKKEASIQYDIERGITAPLNALVKWTAPDGEKYDVRIEWRAAVLVQTLTHQKEGTRTNSFTVSPDGKTVSMFVVVRKPKLPEPLTYKLVFNRAG
jgi:hypothetical protein